MKKSNKSFTYFFGIMTMAILVVLVIVLSLIASGMLKIKKTKLIIETGSASKFYDGDYLSSDSFWIIDGNLKEDHKISLVSKTRELSSGDYQNVHKYVIKDKNGDDVTDEYELDMVYGTLLIVPRKIIVATNSSEKKYDGTPLIDDQWHFVTKNLAPHDLVEVEVTGEQTEVGESLNTCKVTIMSVYDEEVTSNYDLGYELGSLSVKGKTIVIATENKEKEYDTTPISGGEAYIENGELYEGHKIVNQYTCKLTAVGSMDNVPEYSIVDEKGNDVSDQYEILTDYGTLKVTPRKLIIETASAKKRYDGNYLTKPEYVIRKGSLIDGDEIDVVIATKIRNISSVDNRVTSLQITRKTDDGVMDVTNNYQIEYIYGTLLITK